MRNELQAISRGRSEVATFRGFLGFLSHNRISRSRHQTNRSKQVLVEFNSLSSSHIAYSYLCQAIGDPYPYAVKAYSPRALGGVFRNRILASTFSRAWALIFPLRTAVYKSFGSSALIRPFQKQEIRNRAENLVLQFMTSTPSKRDLENFTVEGVLIGDLFYDTYLRVTSKPTIEVSSQDTIDRLARFVGDTLFWLDYFSKNEVAAVIASHCVYGNAIPLRVAVQKSVPAFQATATSIYRLSHTELFAYKDTELFPEKFRALSRDKQEAGRSIARKRLEARFRGEVGVDMPYSTESAYQKVLDQKSVNDSENSKILVAAHCFFDSPHPYGIKLFPDFWEWLHFLGRISNDTTFDWYLKSHRDYLPGNIEILEEFVRLYPRFQLLPSDASHHQLIAEGIDVALTVHGTIGFEYPYLGVPVINASQNNPHSAYSFNFHPASLEEYEKLIRSIPAIKKPDSSDQRLIEEFYYMKNFFQTTDLFFDDFDELLSDLGGTHQQFTSRIYREFHDQLTPEKHGVLLTKIKSFILNGDYMLAGDHSKEG